MKFIILIDNIKDKNLEAEWGLSIYIEDDNKKYLLDAGSTNKYSENAKKLGIDLSDVDYSILSHAHYDHSGGFDYFFDVNKKAKLYVSHNAKENCFSSAKVYTRYIGLPKGMLEKYKDRIEYVNGFIKLEENAYIMEHANNSRVGKLLFVEENGKLINDNFSHEQNLVFDTPKGLVILNSCSHIGPDHIIEEVKSIFKDKEVYMYIGGLHLVGKKRSYIKDLGDKLKTYNVKRIYTGHCTRNRPFRILKRKLGDSITQIKCGMEIEC